MVISRFFEQAKGPNPANHVGFLIAVLGLVFCLVPSLSRSQDASVDSNTAETTRADMQTDILIVDVARVRSTANAYISIQTETERVRDVVNEVYQERLAALQAERDVLVTQEFDLEPDEFQTEIARLEQRAIDLETRRRRNFSILERRRQEANLAVDSQLNAVLTEILEELEANYILNQQSALIWPNAANVTDLAVERLNARLSAVNFQVNIQVDEGDGPAEP